MAQAKNPNSMQYSHPIIATFSGLQLLQCRALLATVFVVISALIGAMVPTSSHALESLFGDGPKPLPVAEAFKPTVDAIDSNGIVINVEIADEYYLYRDKFSVSTNPASAQLLPIEFPEALTHEDEFFGTTHIYRDNVQFTIPVAQVNTTQQFELSLLYQGCADMGLCYPPTQSSFAIELPAAANNAVADNAKSNNNNSLIAQSNSFSINDILSNKTFDSRSDSAYQQPELLRPQDAFVPSVAKAADGTIELTWIIENGYYLYKDKLKFELLDAPDANITQVELGSGIMHTDEYFGTVEIFRNNTNAKLEVSSAAELQQAKLNIHYQGCADIGVCYPPELLTLPVKFKNTDTFIASFANSANDTQVERTQSTIAKSSNAANAPAVAATSTAQNTNLIPESEQDRLTKLLTAGNLGLLLPTFYVLGLLLAFTACVYPMVPILSSIIVGQGSSITTARAFSLSAVYVLSMASVFALLGIAVGLSGYNIQPLFQNPWVLSAFAALFVLLALSMFGLFQLQMPAAIQTKLSSISNQQKGGSVAGVAVMGMLSAVIVGPCVTPPLVAALAYIAKTGDAVLGGLALFALGLGMGSPLLLIGTSFGRFLPKAGGWMESIQRFFGVILLAVALYLLSRFLPPSATMLLAAMLAIFAGVFFGATDSLDSSSPKSSRFGKAFGLVALIYGIVLLIGLLAGNSSFTHPLRGIAGNAVSGANTVAQTHVQFERVKTVADLNNVVKTASQQGKPVMFDFYADWCISCKEMEAFTFTDERVKGLLKNAVLVQADVTANDSDDQALLKEFSLFGPPAILFYNTNGEEVSRARVVGFMNADKFSEHLSLVFGQSSPAI